MLQVILSIVQSVNTRINLTLLQLRISGYAISASLALGIGGGGGRLTELLTQGGSYVILEIRVLEFL